MSDRATSKPTLAILTNARAANQRSMIGYGESLIEATKKSRFQIVEFRGASLLARTLPKTAGGFPRKLANNLDRFIATPLKFAGRYADVVHVVDPGNVVYLPFIRHRRSVVTVHDLIPYLALDGKLPGWRPTSTGRLLMRRILAQLAKVDHIVCVSQATKRDLLTYVDFQPEKISVVPNAVFQPMKSAKPEACFDLRQRLGLPTEKQLVLHVGTNFYKNRETVLNVAARVGRERNDVHFVIVGSLTRALREQAQELGILDLLHVLPHVAREDMATLYTTSSVLLFPSLYEGYGLPVLEAQLCGTPVVCSDRGALPEVAGYGVLMADPMNVAELSAHVIHQLGHRPGSIKLPISETEAEWSSRQQSIHRSLLMGSNDD